VLVSSWDEEKAYLFLQQITDSCKAKRTEAHKKKSHFEALASYMIKNQEAIIEEMLKTSAEEVR